jgi:hypothetical protein
VNRARGNRGLQQIGREPFRDEIRGRHRHPSEEAKRVATAERTKSPARLQQIPEFADARTVERRRCPLEQLSEESAESIERGAEIAVLGGIGFRERADCRDRAIDVR